MLCAVWFRLFTDHPKTWEIAEYDSALYQLDETIKLCIRSAAFAPPEQAQAVWDQIVSYLPTERPELATLDARFTWGTWFQIRWTLLLMQAKHSFLPDITVLGDLIARNLRVVEDVQHMGTFRQELVNPDYAWLRGKLVELKLLKML
jgi:hypothetical protein